MIIQEPTPKTEQIGADSCSPSMYARIFRVVISKKYVPANQNNGVTMINVNIRWKKEGSDCIWVCAVGYRNRHDSFSTFIHQRRDKFVSTIFIAAFHESWKPHHYRHRHRPEGEFIDSRRCCCSIGRYRPTCFSFLHRWWCLCVKELTTLSSQGREGKIQTLEEFLNLNCDSGSCQCLGVCTWSCCLVPSAVMSNDFSEKQEWNSGPSRIAFAPSGHPKLSDGRVTARPSTRLSAFGCRTSAAVVVVTSLTRRPSARWQSSEVQVVLNKTKEKSAKIERNVEVKQSYKHNFKLLFPR